MSKKILVTGGSGLVGNYLKEIIPEASYVSSKDFDLTDLSQVKKMFKSYRPNIVIHLAAKVGGLIDNLNYPADYYDENILINTNTLLYARKYGVERFIGILSSCAYPDNVESFPLKEESLHEGPPNNIQLSYGISKRSFAVQIEAYNKQYGLRYQYLIPCNLYGITNKLENNKSHFITSLVHKIYEANRDGKKYITLYGDGTPLRQFMFAKDMAEIIKLVIDKNITDSFNVAPRKVFNIKEIARIAIECTNSKLDIKFDSSLPNGQIRKDLDINKMDSLIPDYNFTPFEKGIKYLYDYYKNFNDYEK